MVGTDTVTAKQGTFNTDRSSNQWLAIPVAGLDAEFESAVVSGWSWRGRMEEGDAESDDRSGWIAALYNSYRRDVRGISWKGRGNGSGKDIFGAALPVTHLLDERGSVCG